MPRAVDHLARPLCLLLCRVSLGLFVLLVGLGKVRGELNNGLGSFYHGDYFQSLQPAWLPDALGACYGYALPWVELVFAGLLILGLFGRTAATVVSLLLLSILIVLVNAQGPAAGPPAGPFHFNYILLTLAILLAVLGPGLWSIDALWRGKRAKAG